MAWIKFEAARVKRLEKFYGFRREMDWSSVEALGFLGSFWGEAIEVCESGDVTGWTPGYVSELTGLNGSVSERAWGALAKHGWLDKSGGKVLIHDWIDVAGGYLRKKYEGAEGTPGHKKLTTIWAVHGLVYGAKKAPTGNRPETDPEPTPDKTRQEEKRPGKTPPPPPGADLDGFAAWYQDYPNKVGKAAAEKAWRKLNPDVVLRERLMAAVVAQKAHKAAQTAAKEFVPAWPHPSTWINGRRWEDVLGAPPAPSAPGRSATSLPADQQPPSGDPYEPKTPLQRVVCVYKGLKGIKLDDRGWDAEGWDRHAPEGVRLLGAFNGDDRSASEWLADFADQMERRKKPDWTLRWAANEAWDTKGARAVETALPPRRQRGHAAPVVAGGIVNQALDMMGEKDHFERREEESHG